MKGLNRPLKPVRRTSTLQTQVVAPKTPRRTFEPNRPVDRYRGVTHKRWQEDVATRRTS